ncbi:hypothetical protein [Microbacterium rhizomatis]|uniref:Uncharacterized protein n=1 Tax=Microbacterium rhizomatis TaxID=1631477 RepID=A0A5J5IWS6_9MICO|nr:hypothetical protein [Microbacterium rhizomatis]KAA9105526.1 hypothetical protein F6B43_17270 [Microbacterium rhizomatis]
MLNPAEIDENRGITRIDETSDNNVRPLKTGCGKQFAGKMRAKIPEKSGLLAPFKAVIPPSKSTLSTNRLK